MDNMSLAGTECEVKEFSSVNKKVTYCNFNNSSVRENKNVSSV